MKYIYRTIQLQVKHCIHNTGKTLHKQLEIFGKMHHPYTTCIHRSLIDILDSRSLHNVTDLELLDGLVFRNTSSTVGATDRLGVATSVLGPSVIPTLGGLRKQH